MFVGVQRSAIFWLCPVHLGDCSAMDGYWEWVLDSLGTALPIDCMRSRSFGEYLDCRLWKTEPM